MGETARWSVVWALIGMLLGLGFTPIQARPMPKPHRKINQDYLLALGTADRFLHAWQMRDQDAALALISPALKRKQSKEQLRMYLSGLSNPHHEAYEISNGRRLADGRYAFTVRLYEHYTAERWTGTRGRPSRIVARKTGPETWVIDELPK